MGCAVGTTPCRKVYDSPEELDLVHRAKRGDQCAFDALYKAHHTRVLIAVTRYIKDPDTAEWLANKAMANVWHGLPNFQEQSKFSTWITCIAMNEARMHLRSEKKRLCEVPLDGVFSDDDSGDSNRFYAQRWIAIRDLELEGIADRELLERAFAQIPEQFQKVLRLRLFEELSLEEVRARMIVDEPELDSMSSLKSRIHRGRKILLKQVKQLSSRR